MIDFFKSIEKKIHRLGDKIQDIIDKIRGKDTSKPEPPEEPPTEDEINAEKYADGPNSIAHGKSGFLWKPVSEANGNPVILLPPRFTNKTPKVIYVNNKRIGLNTVNNGYREHYRTNHITGPATVSIVATDGLNGTQKNKWTWQIPDAEDRWDSNITPTIENI